MDVVVVFVSIVDLNVKLRNSELIVASTASFMVNFKENPSPEIQLYVVVFVAAVAVAAVVVVVAAIILPILSMLFL